MINNSQDSIAVATKLYDMGFNVIPVTYKEKGPTLVKWKNYQTKRMNPKQLAKIIKNKCCNIGIITGFKSKTIVFDLDSKDAIEWAENNLPNTPLKTYTKRGQQWFYRPKGATKSKIKINFNGGKIDVDLKGDGGYVIAPGSMHPLGGFYTEVNPWDGLRLSDLPIIDPNLYIEGNNDIKSANKFSQKDYTMQEIRAAILNQNPAVENDGGDLQTYKVACLLKQGFKLNDAEALPLMKEWNQNCKPPWRESELKIKLENAEKYGEQNSIDLDLLVTSSMPGGKDFTLIMKTLTEVYHCSYNRKSNAFSGGTLVKQDGNLFTYNGKKWDLVTRDGIDSIKQMLAKLKGNKVSNQKLEAAFKMLMVFTPTQPKNIDMFRPSCSKVNFENGTLHLDHEKKDFDFKPHKREDYLTNIIPYNYPNDKTVKNDLFLEMLESAFDGDSDKDEKILAVKQMFGSCLFPITPRLFFLVGPAGTGKSSCLLPITKLLQPANISSVEPHEFKGFWMESMIGKLINIVIDIDCKKEMSDGNLKKIEDRVNVRIDRKYQTPIYAPLPAIHIFAGNHLPKMGDGLSGAHSRRWTVLKFENCFTQGGYDKSFSDKVFSQSPEGIINFALEGVISLMKSEKHFINPKSGQSELSKWQTTYDWVSLFIQDVERGEAKAYEKQNENKLKIKKEYQIRTTELYVEFSFWSEMFGLRHTPLTRNEFYKQLIDKGFKRAHKSYGDVFCGIGFESDNNDINDAF